MKKTGREMLASPEFQQLVSRKWTVSVVLTVLLFVLYYGYILLVAYNKPYMGQALTEGGVTTRGIVFGIGVIVGAWVLTFGYVMWANQSYDHEVDRLKSQLGPDDGSRRSAG